MDELLKKISERAKNVNWVLLVFLLLVLDVKLLVKLAAFLVIAISSYRAVDWRSLHRQRHLYFYFSMILLAGINFLLQSDHSLRAFLATGFGILLWLACLAAGYFLWRIVQKEEPGKLHNTIAFFFILHFAAVFIELIGIMIECGTLNPYTFRGFNQKYYISTGDHISGITFDSPVTTAMLSAFGVIYFLFRKQFLLSAVAMAALLVNASNLTNILLVLVLLFAMIFKTTSVQKSMIAVFICMLITFIAKVSPQNNEYTARFAFKMLGLTYDHPKKPVMTAEALRKEPDSLLDLTGIRKKTALLYIDSISALRAQTQVSKGEHTQPVNDLPDKKELAHADSSIHPATFYEFRESAGIVSKMNKYTDFLRRSYTPGHLDSLSAQIPNDRPGKWIAMSQVIRFFRQHPGKIITGAGTGNFSSRVAFKTSGLGIAGGYPAKYQYIHPWFLDNHLHLYLHYHAQDQAKHAAENTPDSAYAQLVGEYGLAGLFAFLFFYAVYFFRNVRRSGFGWCVLLLMLGALFTEYWFEQLSVVVLAELLLFTVIKSANGDPASPNETKHA